MNPQILYEDEYILALDKPSGLMVHSDGRSREKTLVDWIEKNRPEILGVGDQSRLQNGEMIERPGIVHRLDKETSGVIVVAKTKESYLFLKSQFQNRQVKKVYRAVVWGSFKVEKNDIGKTIFSINKSIGRSRSDPRKWSAEFGAKGEKREALTEYKILAQIHNNFSYLEVYPKTGRTHQIRVHLKSISHPVVCDKLYGTKLCDPESCLGFSRLALHALSIHLELPNGTFITIESPLPKEFKGLGMGID